MTAVCEPSQHRTIYPARRVSSRVRYSTGVSDNSHYQNVAARAQTPDIHSAFLTHNHYARLDAVGPLARALYQEGIAHLRGVGIQPIALPAYMRLASGLSPRPARLHNQLLRAGLCRAVEGHVVLLDAELYGLPSVAQVLAQRDVWREAKARLRAGEQATVPVIADDCVVKSRESENVSAPMPVPAPAPAPPEPQLTPSQQFFLNIAARHSPRAAVVAEMVRSATDLDAAREELRTGTQQLAQQHAALHAAGGDAMEVGPADAMQYAQSKAPVLPRMRGAQEREWRRLCPTRAEYKAAIAKGPRNWGQVFHAVQQQRKSADVHGGGGGGSGMPDGATGAAPTRCMAG